MRILALIPARAGSKRLPNKNTKLLGDKPLIKWTIDITKEINTLCDVLVSTDSLSIAKISKDAGALVPWLRPAALADDNASLVDVCLHALDWYESLNGAVDGLLLLQPTSPFRSMEMLLRGIELFSRGQSKTVIGVSPASSHPFWCFKIKEELMQPYIHRESLDMQSQSLPPAYVVNGAFYLFSPEKLRQARSIFTEPLLPLISDELGISIDIDTDWDWFLAESYLRQYSFVGV